MGKPLLIYDGDCRFCLHWIRRWQKITADRVDYASYQQAASRFPNIPEEQFRSAVQLVMPDGRVSSGAEAVLTALSIAGHGGGLWIYRRLPGASVVLEWAYQAVAGHRPFFWRLTRSWGTDTPGPSYQLTRRVFLKGLAVIYGIAFVSAWIQAEGLLGSEGIMPAGDFLGVVREKLGARGFFYFPSIFWIGSSDPALHVLCGAGLVSSLLLFFRMAPALNAAFLWMLYLSLVTVGREFFSFQWDALLLEIGFLAIFFAPWKWRVKKEEEPEASRLVVWLYRWLLFRLMFSSGLVKLLSGDPSWRSLQALRVHYETQPLPNALSWYEHQLPGWFQRISCGALFAVELIVPFLYFFPRRIRTVGYSATLVFQLLIVITGNYCFFNLLTILLCLLLLDDETIQRCAGKEPAACPPDPAGWSQEPRVKRWILGLVSVILIASSLSAMTRLLRQQRLGLLDRGLRWLAPFHVVNNYGLFAVMTTRRPEIIVEGSDDGKSWAAYEFGWKPGLLDRRPRWAAPHQPRLDWQMWFAALGTYQDNPWFVNFLLRLLQGSKPVSRLLSHDPFPRNPPRYIRALTYQYHFTDRAAQKTSGNWWRRELIGDYVPVISLRRNNE